MSLQGCFFRCPKIWNNRIDSKSSHNLLFEMACRMCSYVMCYQCQTEQSVTLIRCTLHECKPSIQHTKLLCIRHYSNRFPRSRLVRVGIRGEGWGVGGGGVLGLHWPKLQNDGFYWPKLQKDSYWTNHHRNNGNVVLQRNSVSRIVLRHLFS